MVSQKKSSLWSNFSTPAILAASYLSLQFLIEFPVAFLLYVIQFTDDIVMSRLFVLLISQMIFTAIIIFIIIPFVKVKDVEVKPFDQSNFFNFIAVFCLYWAIMIPITLIFSIISYNLDIEADIFTNVLPFSKNLSENPFSIIIWLITRTLVIAILMEYLYRRTLIPLLEKRGMSPLFAVMTSSIAFALINIPFNLGIQITILGESNFLLNIYLSKYNLIYSLFYSLNLFINVFLLGMACGIIYILTRNILFSILIHSLGLLPYYLMELFYNNIILNSFFYVLVIVINIAGLFITLYTIYSFFSPSSQTKWMTILKQKSLVDINRGLVGFFIIFFGIIFNIVVFLGLLAEHAPIIVTLLFHIVFLGFCFKNLREDLMRRRPDPDHHELKESVDVS